MRFRSLKFSFRLFIFLAVLTAAVSFSVFRYANTASAASDVVVYGDSLNWENWSWNTSISTDATSPVRAGSESMSVRFSSGWAGLQLYTSSGLASGEFDRLQFYVNAGGSVPKVSAYLYNSGGALSKITISSYATSVGSNWFRISIPLSVLDASGTIRRIVLQENTGSSQSTFHIDDLRFVAGDDSSGGSSGGSSSGGSYEYPTGSFKPSQASTYVDNTIRNAVAKYNLPRWFYYAMIQRESSFDPDAYNGRDKGLTQLGGAYYTGQPYPYGLSSPNDSYKQYYYDMNMGKYGKWIYMSKVSRMTDWTDPQQNVNRFSTGYAVPAFNLFKRVYGQGNSATLRRVAFHWNKGVYKTYDPGNCDYLCLYDKYVGEFKPKVESQDGVWDGKPSIP